MSGWMAALPVAGQIFDTLFGSRERRKSPELAGKTAYQENQQGVLGRVEAAKSLGLHPTAVLGGSFGGSGAPPSVGSDFAGAFTSFNDNLSRTRQAQQNDQEYRQRRIEEMRRQSEADEQRRLNDAQINRINKEADWLSEQIRASQAEDVRRSSLATKSTLGDPSNMSSPFVKYIPNEITRHTDGRTHGVHPSVETMKDAFSGNDITVPLGYSTNAEPSELFSMLREASALYGIPLDVVTGQRFLNHPTHPLRIIRDIKKYGFRRYSNRLRSKLQGWPTDISED